MQADAYLGSIADDDTPVGICTSHDCNNHAASRVAYVRDLLAMLRDIEAALMTKEATE